MSDYLSEMLVISVAALNLYLHQSAVRGNEDYICSNINEAILSAVERKVVLPDPFSDNARVLS